MSIDELCYFILSNIESIELKGTKWVNPGIVSEQNGENKKQTPEEGG